MLAANLYGTPQACKVYIKVACAHLAKHGYVQSHSDPNVFKKTDAHSTIIMALTIYEFLVAASSKVMNTDLLRVLSMKYQTKDLEHATRMLNWTLKRTNACATHYHLSQPHKIRQFTDLVGMTDSHPVLSPQAKGHLLHARRPEEVSLPPHYPFAAALGILRYIVD